MSAIFYVVYQLLEGIASLTGLSYEEINIIAYYIVLPLMLFALIDKILGRPIFTITFSALGAIGLIQVRDFSEFSGRIFDWSVDFLFSFAPLGFDYVNASVLICVALPLLLLIFLCRFAFPHQFERLLPTVAHVFSKLMGLSQKN